MNEKALIKKCQRGNQRSDAASVRDNSRYIACDFMEGSCTQKDTSACEEISMETIRIINYAIMVIFFTCYAYQFFIFLWHC